MKNLFLVCLLWLISLSMGAVNTEIKYLSGMDKDHTVTWDFYCTKGMNSNVWSTIQVPSQWEQQGFGAYNYGQGDPINKEQGLYKYHFNVSKSWRGKKVQIVFEGSMTDTEVKINGKPAGPVHQGAFYQFKYDISRLLNYGAENLLEVTVSKESADSSINRAERRGDYWDFGGIFRPVYLEALPRTYIQRVAIDAKADGRFQMDVFLEGIQKEVTLEAQVQTLEGVPFGPILVVKVPKNSDKATLSGSFTHPALWNPETPHLYMVSVRLNDSKKNIHEMKQRFGFRTVEVRPNDGIYVNDKKVMFKGVCRHTFWPESGRCSSKSLSIQDVNTIKEMNMNAVRMSHYPPDQHFLDVCDSLGLFVLDELAGWQAYYKTETGKRLVKQMVTRDVNHPCIVLWDNGNEGGFNKELRNEYAKYDPQQRTVIEPWSKINGTDTKHYPGYRYVENALTKGDLIYFPTEFLHGLYDGGLGAGLDDYWKLMTSSALSAGGFLWVFADEGIMRKDWNDSIDNHKNNAPDGILGPHREKEGSFYTIREIWSPVYIETAPLGTSISVTNRFLYTNLNQCTFKGQLKKFTNAFPSRNSQWKSFNIAAPDIKPGENGQLLPDWPSDLHSYDVFYLTALDPSGKTLHTWSWNLSSPEVLAQKVSVKEPLPVISNEDANYIRLTSGQTSVSFSKTNGLLSEVTVNGTMLPLDNGPVFLGDTLTFKSIRKYASGKNQVVEVLFDQSPDCFVRWTFMVGGLLQLDYQYHPTGNQDFAGITFNFPEKLVTGARLMANGPYHVWKNRLKGLVFDIFDKRYNRTITGETYDYPEFKGFYANFYAVEIQNKILPFRIIAASPDQYLHLFTPDKPSHLKGGVYPPFPTGDISILNGISAIGTKFTKPEVEGPESQKNKYEPYGKPLTGRILFNFNQE
ncbi:MAG TPA: glycoside hydrolase family 2 TIM barrel-domain containing protein [Bacteroidales bacterium]|nr:glycoside hydrolase family 2 TIM barrel-domain containing protein [Bacteroidales bacterium]